MDASSKGRAAGGLHEPSADPIPERVIGALEAELTELGERLARLEARLDEIERGQAATQAPHSEAAATEVAPAAHRSSSDRPVREIGGWPWNDSAEWSYLLRRCEGFRVCDSSGLLGLVESVRFAKDLDLPQSLVVVAGGRGRRRHVEIAASEVADVDPEQRQVKLAVPARAWLFPGIAHRRVRRWLRLPPASHNS